MHAGWPLVKPGDACGMSERLRTELASMLDIYETARRIAEASEQQAQADEAAFLERFARLRREVVRPVFEAAGEILRSRGHGSLIREVEFNVSDGKPTEALIALLVTPAGMENTASADRHRQELSFSTRHYSRIVCITNGAVPQSGSLAGSHGTHTVAQINAQLVEEELLKLMAGMVRR
jgi:hypothetical protein